MVHGEAVECVPLKNLTERDVWTWVQSVEIKARARGSRPFAVIEKVGGFMGREAGEGGAPRNRASAHTMFQFGVGYGLLRMALIAAGIPFEEVLPRKWQGGLGISPRKKTEGKTEWKNRLKARAQQLFPATKVTLATSDALLLAEYARRFYGSLAPKKRRD